MDDLHGDFSRLSSILNVVKEPTFERPALKVNSCSPLFSRDFPKDTLHAARVVFWSLPIRRILAACAWTQITPCIVGSDRIFVVAFVDESAGHVEKCKLVRVIKTAVDGYAPIETTWARMQTTGHRTRRSGTGSHEPSEDARRWIIVQEFLQAILRQYGLWCFVLASHCDLSIGRCG